MRKIFSCRLQHAHDDIRRSAPGRGRLRIAWAAVKKKYHKVGDAWVPLDLDQPYIWMTRP